MRLFILLSLKENIAQIQKLYILHNCLGQLGNINASIAEKYVVLKIKLLESMPLTKLNLNNIVASKKNVC